LSRGGVEDRLKAFVEHKYVLGQLKTGKNTYHWFGRGFRPPRPRETLRRFKYYAAEPPVFDFDQKTVFMHATGGKEPWWQEWEKDGTVVVDDAFKWWWDTGLIDKVLEEFELYRHHFRAEKEDDMG